MSALEYTLEFKTLNDLKTFEKRFINSKGQLDFNRIKPKPKSVISTKKELGWNESNWFSRYNAGNTIVIPNQKVIEFTAVNEGVTALFETAAFIIPKIEFQLVRDNGNGELTIFEFKNGTCTDVYGTDK